MKWLLLFVLPISLSLFSPDPIQITYTASTGIIPVISAKRISFKDVDLLARLIASEALLEPYEGKLAVGQVVLNRMAYHNRSLIEIVYAKGQFDGIQNKYFKKVPNSECLKAAREVLAGRKIIPSSVLFYHNSKASTDKKWVRYIERWKWSTIGLHTFCHSPHIVA